MIFSKTEYTSEVHLDIKDTETVANVVLARCARTPKATILARKLPLGAGWVDVACKDYARSLRKMTAGLIGLGLKKDDRIGIMGQTSYEWLLLDLAAMLAGVVTVPIYQTDSEDQIEWICKDSELKMVFCDDMAMKQTVNHASNVPVYVFSEGAINQVIEAGREVLPSEVSQRIASVGADDLCTIVYTSGTTGRPKGALLTHRNLLLNAKGGPTVLPDAIAYKHTRVLLFLPVAHVLARVVGYMSLVGDGVIGYVGSIKTLMDDLSTFKPTSLLVVPRVLEKVYAAADAKAGRGLKKWLFRWSAKTSEKMSAARIGPLAPSLGLRLRYYLASALVLKKIRALLGGRLRFIVCGGAPLNTRIFHFFNGLGTYLLEGYGLTETAGPSTISLPGLMKQDTVGRPMPDVSLKIAEDGEVLIKSPAVFIGYLNNPEATADCFTEDGWFCTGDLGSLDSEGRLAITGRKKELIVTAGGKNVQPAVLEDLLRGYPIISNVVVVGDGQRFISALITLDTQVLPGWLANHGLPVMEPAQAAQDERVIEAIDKAIDRANKSVSRAESIRAFKILTSDFSEENGMLTPSQKVKRAAVIKTYAKEIAEIYESK